MSSLNKVMLIGNVGKDPEIIEGKKSDFATFSVATTEKWKDKSGERQERTEWHRVVCFNEGLVGVIEEYVKKGSKVYIEGQLQTREYEDKDGEERRITEVVLPNFGSKLVLLGDGGGSRKRRGDDDDDDDRGSRRRRGGSKSRRRPKDRGEERDDEDDEIPF